MFTGIVESIGHIKQVQRRAGDVRLSIATGELDLLDVDLGDSIAVNGVCLTAISLGDAEFSADVSNETLTHTTLGALEQGAEVNLEKAMQLTTRLGGHLVSGHVDGIAEVVSIQQDARSVRFEIAVPIKLAKYIAAKGSVCLDGVSLTVNYVDKQVFGINIVPHTMSKTVIGGYKKGTKVNMEVDVVARYIERLISSNAVEGDSVSVSSLKDAGFIS